MALIDFISMGAFLWVLSEIIIVFGGFGFYLLQLPFGITYHVHGAYYNSANGDVPEPVCLAVEEEGAGEAGGDQDDTDAPGDVSGVLVGRLPHFRAAGREGTTIAVP